MTTDIIFNSSVTYIKIKTITAHSFDLMTHEIFLKKTSMINHLIRNIVDFELICIKQCSN